MKTKRLLASTIGLAAALALPITASAQQRCISEAELSALVVYGVPLAMEAAQDGCVGALASDGFLAADSAAMFDRYVSLSDAAWPVAFRAFAKFADKDDTDMFAQMSEMPEEAIRPFIDEMVRTLIRGEIAADNCRDVERIAEALSVLEPEEAGTLIAVIAAVAELDNPLVCPLED